MPTFVISPQKPSAALDARVKELFDAAALRLENGDWIVSFKGTTQQLWEKIGDETPALILLVNGAWGMATRATWEWLEAFSE